MATMPARALQAADFDFSSHKKNNRDCSSFQQKPICLCFYCFFISSSPLPDLFLSAKKTMARREPPVAAFLEVSFEQLMSRELLYLARRKRLRMKLDSWRKALLRIEPVLADADEKQHTVRAVKEWLDDLRDLAYDVDDILDEFATEALRHRLTGGNQASKSKVRELILSCCTGLTPTAFKVKFRLASEVNNITDRLNELANLKDDLKLSESVDPSYRRREGRPTTSLVHKEDVYGREKDKEALLNLLLGEKRSDDKVCVIPIIGMVGIGKTTLAQLVYNDERVRWNFELRSWVCVSDEFDALGVAKKILESLTFEYNDNEDLNVLQVKIVEKLRGKKFLIILDDFWSVDYDDWTTLRAPLEYGAWGSTIVITTHNEAVSGMTYTILPYRLQFLSTDACFSVFTNNAGASDLWAHPNLHDIGKKIAQRCQGLPLVAKTLGSLLRTKLDRDAWEAVLNREIWDMIEERSGIFLTLLLIYEGLHPHIQRCFAYCSILPKGYEFEEKQLVLLWMAEGLIPPLGRAKQMEDLGCAYFQELVKKSLFQKSSNDESRYMMHDFINDLALWVTRGTSFRMDDRFEDSNNQRNLQKVRHLSLLCGHHNFHENFKALFELTRLRTFFQPVLPNQEGSPLALQLLPRLRFLRVLSLSGHHIPKLPESIGDLKHLRYLDLSNTSIRSMPESTTNLYNLQTLLLENCSKLEKLPSKFWKLVNLRHLNIRNTSALDGMPLQMDKLTCLQTLSDFVVGKGHFSSLKELGPLSHLRETLCISRLENVILPFDAMDANLILKANLCGLLLEWSCNLDDSLDRTIDLEVLHELRPHENLKELTIKCYDGREFPVWLRTPSFPNMVLLRLENCKKCTSLPPVGQLSSLKYLFIIGMAGVKHVGPEFYEGGCSQPFVSLETLCFENMEEWECWIPYKEFPHLRELSIQSCPKLLGKLPDYLPSMVEINGCPLLKNDQGQVVQDSPQRLKAECNNQEPNPDKPPQILVENVWD